MRDSVWCMTTRTSTGLTLAGLYILVCIALIATQGLFGESFIVIILGMPWSAMLAFFEFGNASGALLYVLVLAPLVLNALILYGIGWLLGQGMARKIVIAIGVILAILIGGFFAFNHYIYTEKQGGDQTVESYRGTLTGEVVCLPHKDTDGPHTMECAFGMRTETGEHYALDLALMSQQGPILDSGDRFIASGMITPIELLSTDQWQKYDIEGIFSVTDSVEKL